MMMMMMMTTIIIIIIIIIKYLRVLTVSKLHFDRYMDHMFSQKIGCCYNVLLTVRLTITLVNDQLATPMGKKVFVCQIEIFLVLCLTLILRRSHTGTGWFYTSTSNKRAARPKLYTKSLTRDLKLMYSRLTLVRISIKL